MIHFITGGARSGKSAYAESIVTEESLKNDRASVFYIATAANNDSEMNKRIIQHKARRPGSWHLIEEPLFLSKTIAAKDSLNSVILVDCLTLYLTNWFFNQNFHRGWSKESNQLLNSLQRFQGSVILVSNELGMGLVPMGEENRRFIDLAGSINQKISTISDKATFVVSGLPLSLKS